MTLQCDEQHPSCSLCTSRKWPCTYPTQAPSKTPAKRKATSSFPSIDVPPANSSHGRELCGLQETTRTLPNPGVEVSRVSRMQEMRLFHHASVITAPTLAKDHTGLHFWQITLPEFAVANEYVMDGVLAVAALHLAHLEPENKSYWLEAVFSYQNRAITGLRENLAIAVDDPSANPDSNKEIQLACSILIIVLITAHPGIAQSGEVGDPLQEILMIRSILKGSAVLLYQIYLAKGIKIEPWIHRDRSKNHSTVSKILVKFHEVGQLIEQTYGLRRVAYQGAYNLLMSAFNKWPGENENVIWPVRISESFIALVEEGDWIARILLLFQGLGLHLFSRKWYALDAGRRIVRGVLNPLGDDIPPEWVEMVDWIREAVKV
ncbi:hypothetical protein N7470_006874 [Penicillium chermesinum]|nr:hypothetical protein N7470_006874 [Penicillium chermesinum]